MTGGVCLPFCSRILWRGVWCQSFLSNCARLSSASGEDGSRVFSSHLSSVCWWFCRGWSSWCFPRLCRRVWQGPAPEMKDQSSGRRCRRCPTWPGLGRRCWRWRPAFVALDGDVVDGVDDVDVLRSSVGHSTSASNGRWSVVAVVSLTCFSHSLVACCCREQPRRSVHQKLKISEHSTRKYSWGWRLERHSRQELDPWLAWRVKPIWRKGQSHPKDREVVAWDRRPVSPCPWRRGSSWREAQVLWPRSRAASQPLRALGLRCPEEWPFWRGFYLEKIEGKIPR